ncbi:MAG: site-specific integrase [Syntrophobacteraceae bacterium]
MPEEPSSALPILHAVQSNESLERLERFGQYLIDRGHAARSARAYLRCAEHFERWFASGSTGVQILGEPAVAMFLKNHLPACICSSPGPLTLKEVRAALHRFLAALRMHDLLPRPEPPTVSDVGKEVAAFDKYLVETCGVALETRIYRLRYVREFLTAKYGAGPVDAHSLQPREIMSYLADRVTRCKPGTAKVIAASVRSYLKFMVLRGISSNRMVAAVPTIPQWRMSSIPRVLSSTELDHFLCSFNVSTTTGCRDYAIALCLADLGLRTSEVAALRLEDLNWREGTIRIPGKKSRERILPLTSKVGGAIVDYLKTVRPITSDRTLFLRHSVPPGTPVTCHIVRGVIRRACARVGILPPRDGPHTFRHTLASRMLQSGVALTEVADILGHQTIDTTAIYAKVDLTSLAQVAMHWPEVAL